MPIILALEGNTIMIDQSSENTIIPIRRNGEIIHNNYQLITFVISRIKKDMKSNTHNGKV